MKTVITSYFFIVAILFATVSWSHESTVEKAHKGGELSSDIRVEERITEEGLSEFGVWVPIEEHQLTPIGHRLNGCPAQAIFHGVCHTLFSCVPRFKPVFGVYVDEC